MWTSDNTSAVILLVAGERATLKSARQVSEDRTVQEATTVDEATVFLREDDYSVVFTDWALPDGTGSDLLAAVQEMDGVPPAVVVIDCPSDVDLTERGFDAHVSNWNATAEIDDVATQVEIAVEYDDAIDTLYQLCHEQALHDENNSQAVHPRLQAAREEADRCLQAYRRTPGASEFERLMRDL